MQISKEIDKLSHSVWQRAGNEEEQVPKGIELTRDLKNLAILVDEVPWSLENCTQEGSQQNKNYKNRQ